MEERLCDFRDNNLIRPLNKEELEFVFGTENLKSIAGKLNDNKYGSYLIGGAVGTGKSSLINIVLGLSKKDVMLVNIRFYNESDGYDNFLRVVMGALIDSIEKDSSIQMNEEFVLKIAACKNWVYYDKEEKNVGEEEDSQQEEARAEMAAGLENNISVGVGLKKFFSFFTGVTTRASKENTQVDKSEKRCKKIVTETKREENRIKQIISIINELKDIQVVLVYDELDKMNVDILEKWFAKYKNLFLEESFFNFFLVNDNMYARYGNSDFWVNPLYTCFSGVYYMKLLGFDESLKYCCMMYSNTSYIKGLAIYYNTLGNYRLINARCEDGYYNIDAIKGYILKKVVSKLDRLGYEPHICDILVGRVKRVIETVTVMKEIAIDELNKNWSDSYDVWPRYLDIREMVIEEIRTLDDKLITEIDGSEIFNRYEFIGKQYEILRVIGSKGREYGDDMDFRDIHVRDMYSWIDEEETMAQTSMFFLPKKIKVKEVGENRTENYGNILMKIILANLNEREIQVLILERERGNESFEADDIEYTGIVFLTKGEFTVAYYVDRGSYKSDGYRAIQDLKEGAKKLGVSVQSMKIDRYMNVESEIDEIIDRYNRL